MKNFKFSRLFAAALVVACLALTGCKPATQVVTVEKVFVVRPVAADDAIVGSWVSTYKEKYDISTSGYNNYYTVYNEETQTYASDFTLSYTTVTPYIYDLGNNSGIIYSKFNDANKIGYGATVGQWYALYYFGLSSNSVKVVQAYKNGGKAGCDSLEAAVKEFTVENGYFPTASASVCTKQ